MKVAVQPNGLLIPKRLLRGVAQVDIRKEKGRIVVTPTAADPDPILELGTCPVKTRLRDAAERHDEHLYTGVFTTCRQALFAH